MGRFIAILWLALLALAAPAAAQTFPQLTGRVVDQAGLLRPEQKLDIESKSAALEQASGRQFVVATVRSLEGRPIEDYGYRLGRTWGIGQKDKDDGVILLVAPNEKKVRIETGYGARVFLTDAVSSIIIRTTILPRFKAGDMAGGIVAGADEIMRQMSLSPAEAQRRVQQAEQVQQQQRQRGSDGGGFIPIVFWGMVILFVMMSMGRRARGRRYHSRRRGGGIDPFIVLWGLSELSRGSRGGWGGGGFGGGGWGGGGGGFGGFGGGGGSFGGGGASGSW